MRIGMVGLLLAMVACAAPRRASVSGLAPFPGTQRVVISADGNGDPAQQAALTEGAIRGLSEGRRLTPVPTADADTLQLALHLRAAHAPLAPSSMARDRFEGVHVSLPGDVPAQGDVSVSAELRAPDGALLGQGQWVQKGDPAQQLPLAGVGLARAFEAAALADWTWAPRRASDERLFLTPTALTLAPGEVELSDDEVLALRLAVGLSRRLQFDIFGGVLPIPFAGGSGFLLGPGGGAGGAAGLGVAGAVDLGLKLSLLDEGPVRPALSLAYDLLDVNATVVGVAGAAAAGGNGAVVGAGAGLGTVNAQFNVFTAAATKHLGSTTLTLGTLVIDNHHVLPQSASFAGFFGGVSDTGGTGTGSGSGGKALSRVPTQVQPFASVMQVLGPHSALGLELFPWAPLRPLLGTTGARWVLGRSEPVAGVPVDRIKVRIDAALVWLLLHGDAKAQTKTGVGYLPWVGVGIDFL